MCSVPSLILNTCMFAYFFYQAHQDGKCAEARLNFSCAFFPPNNLHGVLCRRLFEF